LTRLPARSTDATPPLGTHKLVVLRIWRLLPQRSLRRRASRELRESGGRSRPAVWREDFGAALRQANWWRATALAISLNVPFVVGLWADHTPEWLGTAWQVSATLVGLGVAVVVFLLQAAGSQSLSSDTTYRALLAYTWLIWPAAMAVAFVAGVAVVERFGGGESAGKSAWADTWALAAFVVQVIAFGVSFARTVQVVSPAGVRRVLEQSFRDSMGRAARTSLLRRVMTARLYELCQERVSYGSFLTRGQPLAPTRSGVIYDIDCKLPLTLEWMKLGERVTLTLDPGRHVGPDGTLAKLDGARGHWLDHLVRQAVVIRDIDPPTSPVPVFEDVLDVARRALVVGSPGNLKSALQLVVDCLADLPEAYARWGAQYTFEYVNEAFTQATEDQIVRSLAGFSEEVFRTGNAEAALLMPQVAAGLVAAGLREDAALLVNQATSLWRRQLQTAHEVRDLALEEQLHEQIGRLAAQEVLGHQHLLEDLDRPLSLRLAAQPGLELLFRHQIRVLKHYLDAGSTDRFIAAWRHWVEWAKYWAPEQDVDDLELQVQTTTGREHQRAAAEFESANALLNAQTAMEQERDRLMHALGAWALERKQQGKLDAATWDALVPYLVGAASDAHAAAGLLRSVWSSLKVDMLESWQREAWDGQPGWQPADTRLVARFWATILLVRGMPTEGPATQIDLGSLAPQLGPEVLGDIGRIESESPAWDSAIGGDMAARTKVARATVAEAIVRQAREAAQRLADAPLDSRKLENYKLLQRRAYEDGDYLRKTLMTAGAVKPAIADDAFADPEFGQLVPKRPFVDIAGPDPLVALEKPAKDLVWEQLEATFTALVEVAQPWDGEGAAGAAAAIAALRLAGRMPDAVLLPRDPHVRALLGRERHPDWEWKRDFRGRSPQIASLSGVPVYGPGPKEATSLVVCELGAAVLKVERRPEGASPIRVDVETIDDERAAALFDAGKRAPGVARERDAQVMAMRDAYVEVHVDMNVEWQRSSGEPAAWRLELPPVDQRDLRRT
jgi:hypothetical protein